MKMMYEIVAQELKCANLENSHPQDYLNFYCLGNREEYGEDEPNSTSQPSYNGTVVIVQLYSASLVL